MSDDVVVLQARGLCKKYQDAKTELQIFKNLDLEVRRGESIAILGSSGAGKTTLLNLLGGLDMPTAGDVVLCGQTLKGLSEPKLAQLRNRFMGFVYQFHHLLPEFTALENVAMPGYVGGENRKTARQKAARLLQQVGLEERMEHKPSELSGGERQRVAIVRALVNKPQCVLMDEPTGNLDQATAMKIHEVMLSLQKQHETSFVIVTHDEHLASLMDRSLHLEQGALHSKGTAQQST